MDYLSSAIEVLNILNGNGYESYIVGGYVRDSLLNIKTNDIDLTGSAKPSDVAKLFKTIPTGIKYGTVLIRYNGYSFEHTTFRFDGSYSDSRHPSDVKYSESILDDVKRRDFTINALLMDSNKKIIDYTNGLDDLNKKLIRTIGDPNKRFNEDALRMLRALSFVSKLGFSIEGSTYKSIIKNKDLLKNISVERIRVEFDKISNGAFKKDAWKLFYELKLNHIFPNMEYIDDFDRTFMDIIIHNMIKTGEISDFWQFSKSTTRELKKAIDLIKNGLTNYNMFISGYNSSMYAIHYLKESISLWDDLKIHSLKELNISGNDLSFVKKTNRSKCLNYLAEKVLNNILDNDFNILLEEAKKWNISQL
ncbi:MAG: hypothetical protein K6E24_05420 [bacterium]|nr:hypothetical protein [bacterium]